LSNGFEQSYLRNSLIKKVILSLSEIYRVSNVSVVIPSLLTPLLKRDALAGGFHDEV